MPLDPLSFIAQWHRGPTHSLLMIPLWALILGWLFSCVTREPGDLQRYTRVSAVALGTHILADVITAWGVQIFWPLSDYRMALNTTFVIDPLFTGILLLSLYAINKRANTLFAHWGLLAIAAYIGLQYGLALMAEKVAFDYAARQGLGAVQITVLPQPLSPTRWKLVVRDQETYHIAHLDLLATGPAREQGRGVQRLLHGYGPPGHLSWRREYRFGADLQGAGLAREAWKQPAFARFRQFAKLPYRYGVGFREGDPCVWFADLRYRLPGLTPPFRYGMCRDRRQGWRLVHLKD